MQIRSKGDETAVEFKSRKQTLPLTRNALEKLFPRGNALCDGAMGTMLYARGISTQYCSDELNLSQPEPVSAIHSQYLQAGAEIIETNTFGANGVRLRQHGLVDRMSEINRAAVRIARDCVARSAEKLGMTAYVAGAVGPLGMRPGKAGIDEAHEVFAGQIRELARGGPGIGVDLLMIETMTSLAEAGEAIRAARAVAPELPLVVMMTVDEAGNCLDGASAERAAAWLTELGADAVGCNCSNGRDDVLSAIHRMRQATALPLAAMPNAGLPHLVQGRSVYSVSPDEMASFARRALEAGASLIGGCCGTTPDHTRAMKSAMRAKVI